MRNDAEPDAGSLSIAGRLLRIRKNRRSHRLQRNAIIPKRRGRKSRERRCDRCTLDSRHLGQVTNITEPPSGQWPFRAHTAFRNVRGEWGSAKCRVNPPIVPAGVYQYDAPVRSKNQTGVILLFGFVSIFGFATTGKVGFPRVCYDTV